MKFLIGVLLGLSVMLATAFISSVIVAWLINGILSPVLHTHVTLMQAFAFCILGRGVTSGFLSVRL